MPRSARRPSRTRHSGRAILLSRRAFGESSLIAALLTERHGRVDVLARGAYRPTSRFFAVLDQFHTLELTWVERPQSDLALLERADLDVRRRHLPRDLQCYRAAASMVELVELAARAGQDERALFALLGAALDALDDTNRGSSALAERVAFDLAFLQTLGLAPALVECAACGRPAPRGSDVAPRSAFSARAGGRLCRACAEAAQRDRLPVGLLQSALLEAAADASASGAAALAERTRAQLLELCDFLDRFLDVHLESRPRSRRQN